MAAAAPQRRAYTSYRPAAQPLTAPRPMSQISGFSFTNDDGFNSQPCYPSPQLPKVLLPPGSTTYELAEFLKNTGPPTVENVTRSMSARRRALEFLRTHRLTSRHSDQQLRQNEQGLLRLPDSVIAKTSMDGKRYLQIAVPGPSLGLLETPAEAIEPTATISHASVMREVLTRSNEPLDDEVIDTYHSYLQSTRSDTAERAQSSRVEQKSPLQSPGVPPRTSSRRSAEAPPFGSTLLEDPGKFRPRPQSAHMTSSENRNSLSPPSPGILQVSARSSAQSERVSTADTIDSSVSSGVVLHAQSAQRLQVSKPGEYHYPNARKPPTPGPAPTQALPSLPNGHGRMIPTPVGLMSSDLPHRAGSLKLGSNGRVIGHSSGKHGHTQSAAASLAGHQNPSRASTGALLRPTTAEVLSTTHSSDDSQEVRSAEALRNTRTIRERRVRARKMRDIQFMRTGHGTERVNENLNIQIGAAQELVPNSQSKDHAFSHRPSRDWDCELSPSPQSVRSGGSRLSAMLDTVHTHPADATNHEDGVEAKANLLSPVMLVADIEPVAPKKLAHMFENDRRQPVPMPRGIALGMTPPSSARSVSSSSGTDSIRPPPSEQTEWSDRRSSANLREHRASRYMPDTGMEARLNALERKNALLEAALLAVLQTSVSYNPAAAPPLSSGSGYPSFPTGMAEGLLRGS